jgi:HD-GYP domain-containing protein (c-di-GMP phosphodiesterase class II)
MIRKFKFDPDKYFAVPLGELRHDRVRKFPLLIYLKSNDHLILRFHSPDEISPEEIEYYRLRGLECFWCPDGFQEEWQEYRRDYEPVSSEELAASQEGDNGEPRSEEASDAIDILMAEDLGKEEKSEILAEISRNMMSTVADIAGDDPAAAAAAMDKCKSFTEDIIRVAASAVKSGDLLSDMDLIRSIQMEHSSAASSFAVMFAMALGYVEKQDLTDLSMSAFMHDVGFSEIGLDFFKVPQSQYTPEQAEAFKKHVKSGLDLMAKNQIDLSPGARRLVERHHERFDGKGYPLGVRGFELDELSQILSVADTIEELMSGRIDGKERSPLEAVNTLKGSHPTIEIGGAFNRELLATILDFLREKPLDQARAS